MSIQAKVIEDSIGPTGQRLTTMQVRFHRFILSEFNTHRVFSRNFSSSRAIPTQKLIDQVRNDPAMPVFWGKNQPGMQSREELVGGPRHAAEMRWRSAAAAAAANAQDMLAFGLHKQITNRVLEPFLYVTGIVTSSAWDNWEMLRAHPDAQPEIYHLAISMKEAREASTPRELAEGEWHLPYVSAEERAQITSEDPQILQKISAARCCRVSYLKHDGTNPSIEDDLRLFEQLAGSVPIHASPLEHQASPDVFKPASKTRPGRWALPQLHGNLQGWVQFRKAWESGLAG